MAKSKKIVEEQALNITISNEDWKGNIEDVVTIIENGNTIKFSLNKFKQVYGEYRLNN